MNSPADMHVDGAGNLYILESRLGNKVRKVDTSGIITTVVGDGRERSFGDGGPATEASLDYPRGLYVDGAGNIFISELFGHRIRKVDASGMITTVVGTGEEGFSGDGGPAIEASLNFPGDVFGD